MKTVISIVLAGITTFGLFAFMAYLVNNDQVVPTEALPQVIVEFAQIPDEKPAQPKPKFINEPPPPPEPMPRTFEVAATTDVDTGFNYEAPDIGPIGGGKNIIMNDNRRDSDARPIVRINPTYPIQAARDGIQGWVKLSFDIDTLGSVTNVVVLDAEPKRIFNKAARKALKKWKYRAQSSDGKTIKTQGLTVQLDFNIDQQS